MLQSLKEVYLVWYGYYQILPKTHRHSIGVRIDKLYIEAIEAVSTASFLPKDKKLPFVLVAIRKIDVLQVLLQVLWETESLDTKKYSVLAEQMNKVGRMLGGWKGQLSKQNSPANAGEKRR